VNLTLAALINALTPLFEVIVRIFIEQLEKPQKYEVSTVTEPDVAERDWMLEQDPFEFGPNEDPSKCETQPLPR